MLSSKKASLSRLDQTQDILNNITELHKLVFEINHFADTILKQETDLTFSQFLVLSVILKNCNLNDLSSELRCSITQKNVAVELGETQAALSRQVDNLKKKKYIKVIQSSVDKRAKILVLTESGRYETEKGYKVMNLVHSRFFNDLSKSELENLQKKVHKVVISLEESV